MCALLAVALAIPAVAGSRSLAAAAPAPHVRVVRLEPKAVVRGTGFEPRERLLVRLVGRGTSSKRLSANDQGSFRAVLRTPPALACGRYALIIVRPVPARPLYVRIGPPECAPDGGASP